MGGVEAGPPDDAPAFKPKAPVATRRLMFTADDFGLSPSLNQAVALAHRFGMLGQASLLPAAPAASQAVFLARNCPDLCLGVHLTLIQGRAVLPPRAIPKLVDSEGRFPVQPVGLGWRYFWQTGLLPDIRREIRAQIEAVLATGLPVWHLNGHLNLHLHPRLAPLVVDLAREYAIPALRLAAEDWRATLALAPRGAFPKMALGVIFAILSRRARRLALAAGLVVNDHLFGLTNPGSLTEEHLLGLLPRLRPGLTEIYSHPAMFPDPALEQAAASYQRVEEFKALTSPRLRDALRRHDLKVMTFREMVQERSRWADHFSP
ncbi:MAG: hopanoid biosynthesis-associated protein HpnK [Desulfobaccales bacterium]